MGNGITTLVLDRIKGAGFNQTEIK